MTDSRWLDPEIDSMLDGDAELTELAHRVRAARPEPPLDDRFRAQLRAQLMREAPAVLGAPGKAARPSAARTIRRRRGWWRPAGFAWGGAGLGVALAAAAVLTIFRTPVQDHQVTAMSPVAELHAVSPDNVITVAFSEPMNQAAVVAGLHIQPATTVTTAWQGNTLVITPAHHLAGNTPYTVTIDHSATRSASGQLAAATIRIAFGTAPTPPPAPAIAQLSPTPLGPVTAGAQLLGLGDGSVVATASTATPTQPATTAAPAAIATAGASASASPSAPPTVTPLPGGDLVVLAGTRGVTDLGAAASSAALAPGGLRLVAAIPSATGSTIEAVPVDGSARTQLTTLATQVLATGWLDSGTALVAEPDRVVTVDLTGHVATLMTLPAGTTSVIFSADGTHAFAGSAGQDGVLVNLGDLSSRPLPGSRTVAAFSGDGRRVAWVDGTGPAPRLLTSPVARDATAAVPVSRPGNAITAIALDHDGTHVAVVDEPSGAGGALHVLALPSGAVVATGPDASAPAYSATGDELAFIAGGTAQVATVPGVAPGTTVNLLPDGAADTLKAFVDAQVAGDAGTLRRLSAAGADAVAATPDGISRAYVISSAANPDGSVSATAWLIADPTATRPSASFSDETLVLRPVTGGGFTVTSLTASALHAESVGPHVLSVVPVAGPTLVLRVSFDSDLRDASVAPAITVRSAHGAQLAATTVYDAASRTATVTVSVGPEARVTLSVDSSIVDVDGQALAAPFTTTAGG